MQIKQQNKNIFLYKNKSNINQISVYLTVMMTNYWIMNN